MNTPLILQAFSGKNKQIPVWFMRQAGRFLPEYRAIRKSHSLDDMFRNPQIVAAVTCLPIDILKVDAAILFADILTLPMSLGFDITFDPDHGPIIKNTFESENDFRNLHKFDGAAHIEAAIPLINKTLPQDIPLIGFAGAPFSVLCYLVEGGSSTNFRKVFKLAFGAPHVYHRLMNFLTDNTIAYLQLQKKVGIQLFQLFDSWGGILREEDYRTLILPYVQRIFKSVDLPSIYFLKNCAHALSAIEKCGSDFLSVCETVDLADNPVLRKTRKGIQGNLFQGLLYSDDRIIEKEVLRILQASTHYKKYIFNLSHGIQPDISVEKVKRVVELVHNFKHDS